ncbi:MAG: LysR family transcriptional regulator [Pseudomonadota bacterium]
MASLNLKQLEAFVEVANTGNFRRAAEKLNTTQPNISARISGLEAQLNVRLMERDAGSVRLTPIGETLLSKAREILRALEAFTAAAGDDALIKGRLRLGVTEVIVHSWLTDFLAAFKHRYPNIDVELIVDLSVNLSTGLFSRSIDLAFQSAPFERKAGGVVELGKFAMMWVAAPALGFEHNTLTLADIARQPIITHARGTLPFDQLRHHITEFPEIAVRLIPSTNIAACMQMTLQGLGAACLPEVMVRENLENGKLIALDYIWTPEPLNFFARFEPDVAPGFVAQAADLARHTSSLSQNPLIDKNI